MNKQNKQASHLIEEVVDADVSCRVKISGLPRPCLCTEISRCLCTGRFAGNHRIIELFELEGMLKSHLVQLPAIYRGTYSYSRLLTVLSSPTFDVSNDGSSTTSLGSLFQYLCILIVKIFLISSLNLPSFTLKPFLLVLSQQILLQSLCLSFF